MMEASWTSLCASRESHLVSYLSGYLRTPVFVFSHFSGTEFSLVTSLHILLHHFPLYLLLSKQLRRFVNHLTWWFASLKIK